MEGLSSSHLSGLHICRTEGSGNKNLFCPGTAQGRMETEDPGAGPGNEK